MSTLSALLKHRFVFLRKVKIHLGGNQHYATNAVNITSTISAISIGKYMLEFSVQLCFLM